MPVDFKVVLSEIQYGTSNIVLRWAGKPNHIILEVQRQNVVQHSIAKLEVSAEGIAELTNIHNIKTYDVGEHFRVNGICGYLSFYDGILNRSLSCPQEKVAQDYALKILGFVVDPEIRTVT